MSDGTFVAVRVEKGTQLVPREATGFRQEPSKQLRPGVRVPGDAVDLDTVAGRENKTLGDVVAETFKAAPKLAGDERQAFPHRERATPLIQSDKDDLHGLGRIHPGRGRAILAERRAGHRCATDETRRPTAA
jgi:hypothetical protein